MRYYMNELLNNASGEVSEIERYEKYVLDFLCSLHKQAVDLECQGDPETGRKLREMIARLLTEFEKWQNDTFPKLSS
jgi:hypothetical protein